MVVEEKVEDDDERRAEDAGEDGGQVAAVVGLPEGGGAGGSVSMGGRACRGTRCKRSDVCGRGCERRHTADDEPCESGHTRATACEPRLATIGLTYGETNSIATPICGPTTEPTSIMVLAVAIIDAFRALDEMNEPIHTKATM